MAIEKLKISAIILTKNEADRIDDCLDSLDFVDELIIIDNGSDDKTVMLAQKHGATVYEDKVNDFSKLRELGREKAQNNWLLYIDADERVTAKLEEEIKSRVKSFLPESAPHAYFVKRRNFYLGREWPYQDKLERLFWKKSLSGWRGKLHETAKVNGPIGTLEEPLLHYTHRTVEEMVDKTNSWSNIEAQLRLRALHPPIVWWRLLRVMWTGFWQSFIEQGGCKVGTVGWIESIYQAFSMFITYAKLWELQQKNQK